MKKYILSLLFLVGGFVLLQSCKKSHETKYISLDETIQSGKTYSLDLGTYGGDRNAIVTISTQAAHYTTSQIDKDPASANSIYHFSNDGKLQEKEKIVINVSKGKQDNNGCDHDHSENKTVVTINMTVL